MLKTAKKIIRPFKYWMEIHLMFLRESFHFYKKLNKHNASINTNKNIYKMEYTLLREIHVIEKGMSLRSPRKGFGQENVLNVIKRINLYIEKYGVTKFLEYPLSTINKYIKYTKLNNIDISNIENEFKLIINKTTKLQKDLASGIKQVSKEEIIEKSNIDFESFVKSRHSIRFFSTEVPSIEKIERALILAQQTPSACNRQSWLTHVFTGEKCKELILWQGGARGFEDELKMAILVTANMNAFLFHEPYQPYVDGGLYAMTLIFALHSLGLGTIPLSTGFSVNKIKKLHLEFSIPENEVLIMIIGVGELLEEFNVAASSRKLIEVTNKWE